MLAEEGKQKQMTWNRRSCGKSCHRTGNQNKRNTGHSRPILRHYGDTQLEDRQRRDERYRNIHGLHSGDRAILAPAEAASKQKGTALRFFSELFGRSAGYGEKVASLL